MRVASVDLGAGSGRVCVVDLDTFELDVVHRFANEPIRVDGTLRWDVPALVADVEHGLRLAGPVASVGVDTWGVDYGLLDADGALVAPPYCYRDERTHGWRDVIDHIGAERVYRTTGIQLMAINTLCQLAVHDRRELDRATRLLMMPELIAHALCGAATGERTSAGTTQLVDLSTRDWSTSLIGAIDVDPTLFPPIGTAGTRIGTWRDIPVHLVGGHDTASAVAALPDPAPGAAFVSSGTWSLVGAERPEPDTSDEAMRANFSNEPSVFEGYRFLRNVMGLWMLDECRRAWGGDLASLLAAAADVAQGPTVDATDERFLAPDDMEAEVRDAAGLPETAGRDVVARVILDSLARTTADVIHQLESFLGHEVPEIVIVGGGSRNALLNRLIGEAAQRPVRVGPAEATALGNALVQGIALGRFAGLDEARQTIHRG